MRIPIPQAMAAVGAALLMATQVCLAQTAATTTATQASPVPTATATAAPATAVTPAVHAGFVKSVHGSVHLLAADGSQRPVHEGDSVAATDRLVTDADGAAGVVLRDGTALVLGPSSQLDIRAFDFDSTTRDGDLLLSLLRGSLRMVTGLIGKTHPEAVRVETQTATIGVRGTDFIVQADATR